MQRRKSMLGTRFSRMLNTIRFAFVDINSCVPWVSSLKQVAKSGHRFPACSVLLFVSVACLPLSAQCTLEVQNSQESSSAHRVPPEGFPVSGDFQALIDHAPNTWPLVPVNTLRLFDTGTAWYQMNPSEGVYDWHVLDTWLKLGAKHNVTFLMTLALTPLWASSNQNDPVCRYSPGVCAPPDDLNPDGG